MYSQAGMWEGGIIVLCHQPGTPGASRSTRCKQKHLGGCYQLHWLAEHWSEDALFQVSIAVPLLGMLLSK